MYDLHRHPEVAIAALVGSLALSAAGVVRADHDMAMSENHHAGSELSVGLSVEAAAFDNTWYVGSYQAVAPSAAWMHGGFGASATIGLYHLLKNGLSSYGVGDAMLAGHAMLAGTDTLHAGVALHAMLPTGSEIDGLGMGHAMVMPSAWASWRASPLTFSVSAGYGRALVALGGGQHDHGPMPLVDPMNLQELTWSAGADLDLGHRVQLGGRTLGAAPIGTGGTGRTRVIGGGRLAWGTPRISTALELQVGLAGDPFTVRGVLDTALRF